MLLILEVAVADNMHRLVIDCIIILLQMYIGSLVVLLAAVEEELHHGLGGFVRLFVFDVFCVCMLCDQ